MAAFAMCDDGTIRKVVLQKGHARKLHNYVKHNLSGGMVTLAAETVLLVPAEPKKKWWTRLSESFGRKLHEWRQPLPPTRHTSQVTGHS